MKIRKIFLTGFFIVVLCFSLNALLSAAETIRIVATTTTFGSIAAEIAGDRADVYSIASPRRDVHFIAPTPKDILKVKKADVLITGGLDLEVWRGPLLNAAGRADMMWPAGPRQIDASKNIHLLEVPDNLSRAQGDIHAFGNPHYWTDPVNGKIIARNITDDLSRLYPESEGVFEKNYQAFSAKLEASLKTWEKMLEPYQGKTVVTYHKSLIYFTNRFGLIDGGQLEPKPGIPPTARHLTELENRMRRENIRVIIQETFYEKKTARKIAQDTDAQVVFFAQAVDEVKEAGDYLSMIDYDVRSVAEAFKKAGGGQ